MGVRWHFTRSTLSTTGSNLVLPVHATFRRTLQEMEDLLLGPHHLSSIDQYCMHGRRSGDLWTQLKPLGSYSWKYLLGITHNDQGFVRSRWYVLLVDLRFIR
jgi:hypothetical protein